MKYNCTAQHYSLNVIITETVLLTEIWSSETNFSKDRVEKAEWKTFAIFQVRQCKQPVSPGRLSRSPFGWFGHMEMERKWRFPEEDSKNH